VLCLAETTKSSILIDPDTLDTVGKFRYADKLGGMMIQSAHPITVTTGGEHNDELLMVLPDLLAPRRGYLVVRMASGSNKRKVISRVDCRGGPTPGWMHSFAVTDTYVVVPEMPLRYSASGLVSVT
jgi:carlactone synthase/all-trans-10'-apo-beta-carotenal 13,14-cleaving dioxygenase